MKISYQSRRIKNCRHSRQPEKSSYRFVENSFPLILKKTLKHSKSQENKLLAFNKDHIHLVHLCIVFRESKAKKATSDETKIYIFTNMQRRTTHIEQCAFHFPSIAEGIRWLVDPVESKDRIDIVYIGVRAEIVSPFDCLFFGCGFYIGNMIGGRDIQYALSGFPPIIVFLNGQIRVVGLQMHPNERGSIRRQ